jgi:gas vesicle protein
MKFLLGFAVGLGLGLLFAPASGEETRRRLISKMENKTRGKATGIADISQEKAGQVGEDIGRRVAEAAVQAVKDDLLSDKGKTA